MRNLNQTASCMMALLFWFSTSVASVAAETALLADLQKKMQNSPASSVLFFTEAERRVAFKSSDLLYPTREIKAGSAVYPLGERPTDILTMDYELNNRKYTLNDFFKMPYSMGFLVVQDGNVLFEYYAPGNDRNTRWISFSVAKSVTSMLIGAAIKDGYIASVDEPASNYLPRLRGTPYETVTIENILQMSSGIGWNEDYEDPHSDVARAGSANGLELVDYLSQLPRQAKPGEVFNYNTGETNLVGEILRAAIGNNASTYLTYKIWQPYGMESDASWMTNVPGGVETGGCCINATLRDYARIGLFAMSGGVLADGTAVLPDGWMMDSITPSKGYVGYGYLWWPHGDGAYSARGIFQQQIYINPAQDLVIAVHGNAPTAVGSEYSQHLSQVIPAIARQLK